MKPEERLMALNQVLKHCQASPFYRDRLPTLPLSSLEEIKQIPLTTKEDLKDISPFGLICVNPAELFQYHETFGTTGTPVSTWYTREDFRRNVQQIARWGVNFNKGDRVLIRFPYAISGIAHLIHALAQMQGACVIPAGARTTVSPFPRIINLLQKLEVTVLACLPLQAILLAETAEMLGHQPDHDFPHLRAIGTAGEVLSPARRKLLEDIWGVPVFDNYGMTEIGAAVLDCQFREPHPLEDSFIFEILGEDRATEVKPGETGYLVVTTLNRKAAPILRYFTGDRARLVQTVCPCGKGLSLQIVGRQEDALKVGGREFYLGDLEEIVSHLPCRRFWVAGPSRDGLRLVVELEKPTGGISAERLRMLEDRYNIKLEIEMVPRGTLYDRDQLLDLGVVGKPKYLYSAAEIEQKKYVKSTKL